MLLVNVLEIQSVMRLPFAVAPGFNLLPWILCLGSRSWLFFCFSFKVQANRYLEKVTATVFFICSLFVARLLLLWKRRFHGGLIYWVVLCCGRNDEGAVALLLDCE